MMRARRLATICFATLAATAFTAGPADAHLVRPLVSSFTPAVATPPISVAIDNTEDLFKGDVYVTGAGTVERYSPAGVRDTSFASPTFEVTRGVAVDNSIGASKGDVYVAVVGATPRVVKLDSSGKEVAGFT